MRRKVSLGIILLFISFPLGYMILRRPLDKPWPLPEPPPIYPEAQAREGDWPLWVRVYDEAAGDWIEGAEVTLGDTHPIVTGPTDMEGNAKFLLPTANYNCVIIKEGYELLWIIAPLEGDSTAPADPALRWPNNGWHESVTMSLVAKA